MRTEKLEKLGACKEAIIWARDQKSQKQAWNDCKRGDWMLWLTGRLNVNRKTLVLCACECARLALKYVQDGETRPLKAIETAEKWTRGEATIDEVIKAANASYDVACAAAYAAADSADAADASDAYVAYAVADAASYAAVAAGASANTLLACADIVRKHFPNKPRM